MCCIKQLGRGGHEPHKVAGEGEGPNPQPSRQRAKGGSQNEPMRPKSSTETSCPRICLPCPSEWNHFFSKAESPVQLGMRGQVDFVLTQYQIGSLSPVLQRQAK